MKFQIRKALAVLILPVMLSVAGCQSKTETVDDNKDVAEEKNDDKFTEDASEKDAQFVVDAISSNLAEVGLAEVAEQHATDKEVKELATMLKSQHMDVVKKLQDFAAKKKISLPTAEPESAQRKADNIADDKNFDKKWCSRMKEMHEESIKNFEDASNTLADADLKAIAAETLPVIRSHYDKIVACDTRLK